MKSRKFTKSNISAPTEILVSWLQNELKLIPFGEWEIVIQKPKRNNDQNACLHGWLKCIDEHTGQGIKELYKYYCEKYNSKYAEHFTYFKSGVMDSGATSKMKMNEFAEFLTNIQFEAATEFGITLPTRDSIYYQQFYEQYIR